MKSSLEEYGEDEEEEGTLRRNLGVIRLVPFPPGERAKAGASKT